MQSAALPVLLAVWVQAVCVLFISPNPLSWLVRGGSIVYNLSG